MRRGVIAIVDDDEAVQDSLCAMLESFGYPVRAFSTGQDFIDRLDDDPVACVILDVNLPGISGWEVLDRLTQVASPPAAIVVSGNSGYAAQERAARGGALCYMEKPIDRESLFRWIDKALAGPAGGCPAV